MTGRLFDTGDRTARERRELRRTNAANARPLFEVVGTLALCAVCAGDHDAADCPHGTAAPLF